MASVKLVGTLTGIFLLVLLSRAARLPQPADENSALAVVVPSDELDHDAANLSIIEASSVEKEEGAAAEKVTTITDLVEGSDHADLSLRRPFHGRHRHRHCRHSRHHDGRGIHGGEIVIPYGNDMIPMPKDGDLPGGLIRKDEEIPGAEVALSEEERMRWRKKRDHKRKKAEEDSDSDSDSDDEDEGAMEMAKKKHRRWRKKKERKEKDGWVKWFLHLWD